MLSHLIWTAGGLVLAGGGVYAAAAFVPSVAMVLKATLDFACSPIGTAAAIIVGAVVLFGLAYAEGDVHGSNAERAEWRADTKAKQVAADRLVAENKVRAKAEADARIQSVNDMAAGLQEKVDAYEQEIAKSKYTRFRLRRDDIERMRRAVP